MTARRIAALIAPPCAIAAILAACSSSTVLSTTDAGTSSGAGTSGLVVREDANEEPLPKRLAAVSTRLQPSSVTREPCPFDGPFVDIGKVEPWQPIEDGSGSADADKAGVFCRVIPNAAGTAFDVFGSVDSPAAPGTPRSTFQGTISASGDGSPVIFSISKNKDDFASNQCRFNLTKPAHGIAAGRFWGTVVCEEAETITFDKLCRSIAEVRFENCRTKE